MNGRLQQHGGMAQQGELHVTRFYWVELSWILVLAFVVRVTAAWMLPEVSDERLFSRPTIEGILQGQHFLYLYHNMYMAPISEYLAAGLWKVAGPSLLALRLPAVIFGVLAAGVWWLSLAPLLRCRSYRVLLGVYLAAPSYSILNYEMPAAPEYAAGHLLVALWFYAMVNFPLSARAWQYAGLALFAGLATYVFLLFAVPMWIGILWLGWREGSWQRGFGSAWTQAGRDARAVLLFGFGLAIFGLGAGGYHWLTRPVGYHVPMRLIPAWIVGLAGLLILGWWVAVRVRANWRLALRLACVAVVAPMVAKIPEMAFQRQFRQLPLAEQQLYNDGASSVLEHAHQWPVRTLFTMQVLVPQSLLGARWSYLDGDGAGYVTEVRPVLWRVSVGVALVALWGVGLVRGWSIREWRPALMILGGCVFLILALFCVTYKSANYYNFRYLAVFSPGLFMLLAAPFRASRWGVAFLTAVVTVGVVDLALALLG